jgi:dTDP-4-dehydrorhamnose 3,5-epimerase
MPFQIEKLGIPDVLLITPTRFDDDRGFFMETYKRSDFVNAGLPGEFRQDNCSLSRKGVIRGLHYQMEPAAQGKLLRAVSGSLYEVAVDIRKGSPHFGHWTGALLSADRGSIMWIPPGFAAGLVSLEDGSQLTYKTTAEYSKPHERGILWNDPEIGIRWPGGFANPIVSDKDRLHPRLRDAETNFVFRASDRSTAEST